MQEVTGRKPSRSDGPTSPLGTTTAEAMATAGAATATAEAMATAAETTATAEAMATAAEVTATASRGRRYRKEATL